MPVWLVGTSRGTESAAYAATLLTGHDGPDGIVLTSTILTDTKEFSVPSSELDRIKIPGSWCITWRTGVAIAAMPTSAKLMDKLDKSPRKRIAAGQRRR